MTLPAASAAPDTADECADDHRDEVLWEPAPVPPAAASLAAAGIDAWLAPILARRGVADGEAAERFLAPKATDLHDPFLLDGMEAAVSRLLRARERGEKVAIVGDYDVDGVSATALLSAVFGACGLAVETIVPHRLEEGYGFQPVHAERAKELGCGLVVTADCGTTAVAAVEAAGERGIDVVVTDHHLPGPPLPSGTVQINPKQEACAYPFGELCGAGLAFKLALGLARRCEREVPLDALLRIACLGTIADLVPLVGENRVIAALGLEAMGRLRSPGLLALLREARVARPVTAVDVGFRIGPRLNAAGRLGSAEAALELLLTRDRGRSAELARQLDQWNRERQGEEQRVVEEAREAVLARKASLGALPPVLVAWQAGWHPGVVGIAAGRLAKEFHRPTILLSLGLDEVEDGETATGSGRSVGSLDLHGLVAPFQGELLRFGGHAMALGLTAPVAGLEDLRRRLEEAAALWPAELLARRHRYELELSPADVGPELLARLERLEPHGEGNPRPLLRVGPLELVGVPRSFGRGHLGGRLKDCASQVHFVGWGWQERAADLRGSFEVLAYLERDNYRQAPVLRLVDCRPLMR